MNEAVGELQSSTGHGLVRRLLANMAGQFWSAVLGLVLIPLYVQLLGMEAFGLIGLGATLQGLSKLFDLGLTQTAIRETARLNTGATRWELHRFFCAFEGLFFLLAAAIVLIIGAFSPWLGARWIRPEMFSPSIVTWVILLLGLTCGVAFLVSYYQATLVGLQRQVFLNAALIVEATVAGLGALAIVKCLAPSIVLFFAWRLLVAVLAGLVYAAAARRGAQAAGASRGMDRGILHSVFPFASGLAAITVIAVLLTQADKVLLSRLLTLRQFGDYSLAVAGASLLTSLLAIPVFNVALPRFTELYSCGKMQALEDLYGCTLQGTAILTLPLVATLFTFSGPLLVLWLQDSRVAQEVAPIFRILALSAALNALMYPAYALQLSHAWTSLGVKIGVFLLSVLVPALLWLVPPYGAVGAAWAMVLVNALYVLIGLPLTHLRVFPKRVWRLVGSSLGPPAAISVAGALASRALWPPGSGAFPTVVAMACTWFALFSLSAVACGRIRAFLKGVRVGNG